MLTFFFSQVTMAVLKPAQAFIQLIGLMLKEELRQLYLYCSAQSKLDIIFSVEIISNFNAIKSLENNHSWTVKICGHFVLNFINPAKAYFINLIWCDHSHSRKIKWAELLKDGQK